MGQRQMRDVLPYHRVRVRPAAGNKPLTVHGGKAPNIAKTTPNTSFVLTGYASRTTLRYDLKL